MELIVLYGWSMRMPLVVLALAIAGGCASATTEPGSQPGAPPGGDGAPILDADRGTCEVGPCPCAAGAWQLSTLASGGAFNRLVLDEQGGVHVGFINQDDNALYYANRAEDGVWSIETVYERPSIGKIGLVVEDSNVVHLVFAVNYVGVFHASRSSPGNWGVEKIISGETAFAALTIDHNRMLIASYYYFAKPYTPEMDSVMVQLKPADGSWSDPQVVDTIADHSGADTAVGVDSAGNIHVAYSSGHAAVVATHTAQADAWSKAEIESNAGQTLSLTIASDDGAHLAYNDGGINLRYAYKPSATTAWQSPITVDSKGYVGAQSSIAIGPDGRVHIVYRDGSNEDFKYAFSDDGFQWATEVVDNAGKVGASGSIAVDAQGGVHAVYHDIDNKGLKYAYGCP